MQTRLRSEKPPRNRPHPVWLRGRQLPIRFPTPGDPPEPPARPPGVIVPPELQETYRAVYGVPALLDSLPEPEGDPAPEAATRRPVHPNDARAGRGGRAYA
jgi:hypothetical protein